MKTNYPVQNYCGIELPCSKPRTKSSGMSFGGCGTGLERRRSLVTAGDSCLANAALSQGTSTRCWKGVAVNATDICQNCRHEYADHNYVADSIFDYKCPVLWQDTCYGYYPGGDPRKFSPDAEVSFPEQIEKHRQSCKTWDKRESEGKMPEPEEGSGKWDSKTGAWTDDSPYGIGVYTIVADQFFELAEVLEGSDE